MSEAEGRNLLESEILLDTCTLIDLIDPQEPHHAEAMRCFEKLVHLTAVHYPRANPAAFSLSALGLYEARRGCVLEDRLVGELDDFVRSFCFVWPFDEDVARKACGLFRERKLARTHKRKHGEIDLMILATALDIGMGGAVVTRDAEFPRGHFRVVDWLELEAELDVLLRDASVDE